MLDVLARSQRGRVCEYRSGDCYITTPFVMRTAEDGCSDPMFIEVGGGKRKLHIMGEVYDIDSDLLTPESSDVFCPPDIKGKVAVARLPFRDDIVFPEEVEVVVVPNAYELRKDARKLIKNVVAIRNAAGYGRIVCMPGIADPSNLALLAYMGIDIFDDSVARASGSIGIRTLSEGCILCEGDVSKDNVAAMSEECNKIRYFIEGERLRELVDQRAPSSPLSVAALRLFDDEGYAYQEEECSTVGCRFACNTTQALRRPEVLRYRRMIMERYEKPANKRILLLLPCSAKKPYHLSKTHRKFSFAIHTSNHDSLVHEVIITSPLGIVPRELDVFFPAKSYDIPVTGEWKCEERRFIREMVSFLVAQGYDHVVSHLGEDTDLIRGICDMEETVVGDPTSPASLTKLDETLRRLTKDMKEKGNYMVDRKETIRSVIKFQFGKEMTDKIMDENTFGIGKFPYWKIMRGDVQLGMLTEERGMISLTIDGAKILAENHYHTVEMTDFEFKGNLFAVGVVDADPSIRIGDEAVVTLNGEVKAVGVAEMSGPEMKQMKRGIAVRIRHKVK